MKPGFFRMNVALPVARPSYEKTIFYITIVSRGMFRQQEPIAQTGKTPAEGYDRGRYKLCICLTL